LFLQLREENKKHQKFSNFTGMDNVKIALVGGFTIAVAMSVAVALVI